MKKYNINKKYLLFKIKNGNERRYISFIKNDKLIYDFNAELATNNDYEYVVFFHVSEWLNEEITLTLDDNMDLLNYIELSDDLPKDIYKEELRPQIHFTSKRGWLNDPNGLFYIDGKYHMFYQHNPFSTKWENMTWGHAVSDDLISWEELAPALYPDELGTMFSGSALVDNENHSSLGDGKTPPILLFYTNAGNNSRLDKGKPFTQGLAYSLDLGKSFTKYEKNPIVNNMADGNRDPKVIKYLDNGYVMALYLIDNDYAILHSNNLIDWEEKCRITLENCSECPDIFMLPVDGDKNNLKWVFWGASSHYAIGDFDGVNFNIEETGYYTQAGNANYAAQTFDNLNRRIQITWANSEINNMPFNQSMNIPCELSLKKTSDGIKLYTYPVKELSEYFYDKRVINNSSNECELVFDGDMCDICFCIKDSDKATILVGDMPICIDGGTLTFNERSTSLSEYVDINVRIVADKTICDVFINEGEVMLGVRDNLVKRDIKVKLEGETYVSGEINKIKSGLKA